MGKRVWLQKQDLLDFVGEGTVGEISVAGRLWNALVTYVPVVMEKDGNPPIVVRPLQNPHRSHKAWRSRGGANQEIELGSLVDAYNQGRIYDGMVAQYGTMMHALLTRWVESLRC